MNDLNSTIYLHDTSWGWCGSVNVAFSPDSKHLAGVGGDNGILKVWDVGCGREVLLLSGEGDAVAFSPDGNYFASARRDGVLKIWHTETWRHLLSVRAQSVTELANWQREPALPPRLGYGGDGQWLASAWCFPVCNGGPKVVDVWIADTLTGQEICTHRLSENVGDVEHIVFSGDGKRLITANGWHKTATVWDMKNGRAVLTLHGHQAQVLYAGVSADGQRIASASSDGTARVWGAETGQEILCLPHQVDGRVRAVRSAAFSADGQWLATASNTVKIWDAAGKEVVTMGRHGGREIIDLAFSPDGKYLASGSEEDWGLVVWEVPKNLLAASERLPS